MNKYETLIFDLDDTLIDNNQSLKYAFTITINKLGLDIPTIYLLVGKNLTQPIGIAGKQET